MNWFCSIGDGMTGKRVYLEFPPRRNIDKFNSKILHIYFRIVYFAIAKERKNVDYTLSTHGVVCMYDMRM